MTSTEFELLVKQLFQEELKQSQGQKVVVEHQKEFKTKDGYSCKIDLFYKIATAGVEYWTIIECKYWDKLVDRDVLNTIHSKIMDLGVHKAIVVSKRGFQKGAVDFAKKYRIALVKITEDHTLENILHADGNIDGYENFLLKDSTDELTKEPTFFGLTAPSKDIYEFISQKCGKEISVFLKSGEMANYLDVWGVELDPVIKEQSKKLTFELLKEYKLIETCGLQLKLINERDIRRVNADIVFLKML